MTYIVYHRDCQFPRNVWTETLSDSPITEKEIRQGELTSTEVNPKLFRDIQAIVSRLVGKTNQLLYKL